MNHWLYSNYITKEFLNILIQLMYIMIDGKIIFNCVRDWLKKLMQIKGMMGKEELGIDFIETEQV